MARKINQVVSLLAFAAAALVSTAVSAIPIQFIYTGTGSGSIGQSSFSSAAFTITQFSDTANLQSCGGTCNFIDADSATVDIAGLGTFNFVTGTRTFDANGSVGLSRAGSGGLDLYNVFSVGAAYDMMSSIGPIAGTASLLQWGNSPVNTNGGVLAFTSGQTQGTFQAIAGQSVPEPSSIALLGLGLAGLLVSLRRKQSV